VQFARRSISLIGDRRATESTFGVQIRTANVDRRRGEGAVCRLLRRRRPVLETRIIALCV
jgi:hypothetical protein